MASSKTKSSECACVDKANVAVYPAEVETDSKQAPDLAQQSSLQPKMSSEVFNSHQSRVVCLPNPEDYILVHFIGQGFGGLSKVFVARHCPSKTLVVVKQTNVDVKSAEQLEELKYEVKVLRSLCHPNILPFYCSFVNRQEVWHILPLMQFGSCADILKCSFPDGMSEILIAAILLEVLQGLEYLHKMGIIHRALTGSHILIGGDGTVSLSGLRKSIFLPMQGNSHKPQVAHHFPSHAVAVLPWMAPEILQQDLQGYDFKSDVYSLGITAIQLGRGTVPYIQMPPTKVLLEKLKGSTPKLCDTLVMSDVDTSAQVTTDSGVGSTCTSLGEGRGGSQPTLQGNFSIAFHQVVDSCLQRDPFLRPTTNGLISHLFFKQVKRKTKDVLMELLSSVPSLANCTEDKRIDQDVARSIATESLSAMTLDEWLF